ncbi:hypothetical protein HPB50_018702 [Hyalomma asiaticum]|uniref:Uncharacterized protein n=1 Tax=Hyalomma asiaticum TaxID=266040 RepID=A0ACB7RXA2_HYAAI|nr:hypothetical protein HPB50_018702 [Hyalomma asiaticum]
MWARGAEANERIHAPYCGPAALNESIAFVFSAFANENLQWFPQHGYAARVGMKGPGRIGSLGEERRDGEIEGTTARRLRLAAPPVTAASAALRLGTRRKPEHPIAIYDGDEARLV